MAVAVIMPRQGNTVESCIITEWKKKVGDTVAVGDILFAYETDKAAFECEAETAGTLLKVLYEEGDDVPVLENVCVIGNPGENPDDALSGAAAPCRRARRRCRRCRARRSGRRRLPAGDHAPPGQHRGELRHHRVAQGRGRHRQRGRQAVRL